MESTPSADSWHRQQGAATSVVETHAHLEATAEKLSKDWRRAGEDDLVDFELLVSAHNGQVGVGF
jgi:hypothetical protein